MRNISGTLFNFFEDVFALRGPSDTLTDKGSAAGDGAALNFTGFGLRRAALNAVNAKATRGLSPMVSLAVTVCPVPPVIKRV